MNKLLSHIQKFVSLDDSEKELLSSGLMTKSYRKKEFLIETGDSADRLFFVAEGCARLLLINDKGNEQTMQFAIENWWIADYLGFHNNMPSSFTIQAVENSQIISIDRIFLEEILAKVPKLEKYFRLCFQKTAGAAQMRIRYLFTMSAEERYHHMNNMFPDFIQRVPQYMIASYLDFSPEFLSKIRAGKV